MASSRTRLVQQRGEWPIDDGVTGFVAWLKATHSQYRGELLRDLSRVLTAPTRAPDRLWFELAPGGMLRIVDD